MSEALVKKEQMNKAAIKNFTGHWDSFFVCRNTDLRKNDRCETEIHKFINVGNGKSSINYCKSRIEWVTSSP